MARYHSAATVHQASIGTGTPLLPFSHILLPISSGTGHTVRTSVADYLLQASNGYFCISVLLASAGQRPAQLRATAPSTSIGQPHQYGLMIECDGVLVDIHKDCHRVAFNMAFEVRFFILGSL